MHLTDLYNHNQNRTPKVIAFIQVEKYDLTSNLTSSD